MVRVVFFSFSNLTGAEVGTYRQRQKAEEFTGAWLVCHNKCYSEVMVFEQ